MKNESNPTNKISYDAIIERSIISPTEVPECGACKKSVFITDTPPATWPLFCIQCGSWYHQKCVEQAAPSGSATICPKCKTGDYVKKATFYCEKCRRSTIKEKANWPKMLCSKCGNEGAVAILTDMGFKEKGWLLILGAFSLVFLLVALTLIRQHRVTIVALSFAGLFALPWLILLIRHAAGEMLNPNDNPMFRRNCGLKNRLLHDDKKFNTRSSIYRYARVYGWLILNTLEAYLVLAMLLYFLRNHVEKGGSPIF